jgi:hypothetical protein
METLSSDENITLSAIKLVTTCFSICGGLFILSIYIRFKELQVFTFKLVFLLAINDVLRNISIILPPEGISCQIQAFGSHVFGIGYVFWATAIAWCLY